MHISLKFILTVTSAMLVAGAVQAKTKTGILVPVTPYPGATTTTVFGIADDNKTIVGSYVDSGGVEHGFTGTLDGNYTSFDYPGADSTQPRGIQGNGKLSSGIANDIDDYCSFIEWTRDAQGNLTQITKDGTPLNGIVQGFNTKGVFTGDYCDAGSGTILGMLGKNSAWQEDVTTPFTSTHTAERGTNNKGDIVGFYVDDNTGLQVGTLIRKGVTSQVSYPDANQSYTVLEGINSSGEAAGQWGDTGGIVHAFAYDVKKSTFTEIDDPAATTFTQAWGVNNSGLIAVNSDSGPFIYCPKKKNCPGGGKEIQAKEIHVSAASMLRYGDGKSTRHKVAPARTELPKGAKPL